MRMAITAIPHGELAPHHRILRLPVQIKGKLTVAMELSGCGTALVTPFHGDGAVDEAALVRLVDWQIESGIDFLIPCGTTGEASTMNEAENLRVVEVVVNTVAGRVPVFGGCTHNATSEAVDRAKKLAKIKGLTGLLTANPVLQPAGPGGPVSALSRDRRVGRSTDPAV